MKVRVKTSAAAVALFAAIAGTASFAQTNTYNPGDLVIGFQATQSGGLGENQNFLISLGSAAGYNNGTLPLGYSSPIVNIGTQLSSTYGNDWFTRADISWGAVGMRQKIAGIGGTGPVVDGDGRGVIYVSKETTAVGESTPWDAFSRDDAAYVSNRLEELLESPLQGGGFKNHTPLPGTGDHFAALVSAGAPNSWSNKNKDGYSLAFLIGGIEGSAQLAGVVIDPETFDSSVISLTDYVYLDIYRYTPDGVDPTWVVTLALDAAGNVYAVPEPSTYAALIGAAGLALVLARRSRRNKVAA